MSLAVTRKDDKHVGHASPTPSPFHQTAYTGGSLNVFANGKNVIQTEKDAKRLFPMSLWNDLHLQIIWYGREYSPARGWDINKDIITKTIGRKSILKKT